MTVLASGTFTHPRSGRLQVVFTMRVLVDGAEHQGQAADVLLRGFVGEGAGRLTVILDARSPTAVLNVDYAANADVPVGIEEADHVFAGADLVGADLLRVACHLLPAAPAALTFDGLLAYMRAELQPMGGTAYVPPGGDDIEGDEWFVRSLAELAVNFKNPTPAPLGYLNDLGRATITDVDGEQIWQDSCIAWGYLYPGDPAPIRLTCTVLDGGTQVRLSGGVDAEGNVLALRWSLTYYSAPNGSGTAYADAWAGLNNINWAAIAPGDTLWVCGLHDDAQLSIQASGAPGAYIKVRLDHPTAAGVIYQSRVVPPGDWRPEPNGEYSIEVTTANNMVFEDKRRTVGPSTTSQNKSRVYVIDPVANTLEVAGERRIYTGMPVHIPQDVASTSLPAGLQFAPARGRPYYAIWVADVSGGRYSIKLADTPEAAAAGTAVDILDAGSGGNLFLWVVDDSHADPIPGALQPGQFGWDPLLRRLYYKPSSGTPSDHEIRLSNDKEGRTGSCIVILGGRQYIRVLGGGQYGGLFAGAAISPLPAPRGQVGLAHLNAIYVEAGNDIVIDGLEIFGARSGVVFDGTVRGTHRNSRVRDMGWHATGGETVTTPEPYLLQERLWVSDIGLGHDYGDCQALVTNPGSTRATFRRCLVQRSGRDSQYVNNGSSIADSSADVAVYRNWFDDNVGEEFECGSGPDGDVLRPLFMSNVVTRSNRRTNPAGLPEHARRCVIGLFCGGTDDMLDGVFAGNLVARSVFQTSAVFTSEPVGVLVARSASTSALNQGHTFTRNAIFGCEGNAYAIKTAGTVANTPAFTADENLFVGATGAFFRQDLTSGPDLTYTASQALGTAPGTWSYDTGNDTSSQMAPAQGVNPSAAPTPEQLEFLRQDDAWDSDALPTLALIGNFPLTP